MAPPNYYRVLGVSRDADENAIKKAYRMLALKHHPVCCCTHTSLVLMAAWPTFWPLFFIDEPPAPAPRARVGRTRAAMRKSSKATPKRTLSCRIPRRSAYTTPLCTVALLGVPCRFLGFSWVRLEGSWGSLGPSLGLCRDISWVFLISESPPQGLGPEKCMIFLQMTLSPWPQVGAQFGPT